MASDRSPFKFLDPYELRDRDMFFGRDAETRLLLADVIARRLVLLFAKSGTGKTSLINAGVRPELEGRDYATFYVRVSQDPTASARHAIAADERVGEVADGPLSHQLATVAAELDQPIAVFFDQFEEFFVYLMKDDPGGAQAFIDDIADVYRDRGSGVHLVFSMREEFFVEMDAFHDAIPTVFEKDSHLRLRWFSGSQAREAIARPAAAAGAEPDPRLVDRLVADLSLDGWVEPAQLQIVCHTLWGPDGLPGLAEYEARGAENPARRILDERLGEAFGKLERRAELEGLERLLPALRTPRGTKYVRDLDGLVSELGLTPHVLHRVIGVLDAAGLVNQRQRGDLEYVELRHDYLVERLDELAAYAGTIWPRRVLKAERAATRQLGAGWQPGPDLDEVAERVRTEAAWARQRGRRAAGDLVLDRGDAELLFLYSLQRGAQGTELLELALEHGLPVWEILGERIAGAEPADAGAALEALGGVETPEALELLERALGQERLEPRALDALARLASSRRRADVADRAAAALLEQLEPALGDPERAGWAVSILGHAHHPQVVRQLGKLLAQPGRASDAEDALLELVDSPAEPVRDAARGVLIERWTQAFEAGDVHPPLLHRLARVHAPETVELLRRAGRRPKLAAEARKALVRLQGSPDEEVAKQAEEAREALTDLAPPPPPPAAAPQWVPAPAPPSSDGLDMHFRVVAKMLAEGRVIPVLGAGATFAGRPDGAAWEPGSYLPTGWELARFLAESYAYPDEVPNLLAIAQYVSATVGSGVLYRDLRSVFDVDYPPPPVHRFLANVPSWQRTVGAPGGLLMLTTNYDDTLERAFAESGEPLDVLTYLAVGPHHGHFAHRSPDGTLSVITTPSEYAAVGEEGSSTLVKLQGGIDRADPEGDSYVIAEDDLIVYLLDAADLNLPYAVRARLRRSHFLFLGHSLRDWSLRVTLARVWRESPRSFASWAIQWRPADLDRALWSARNVELVDRRLEEYVAGLDAVLARPA